MGEHEKELLRQQFELLAEQSKSATDSELPELSAAMCEILRLLASARKNTHLILVCSAIGALTGGIVSFLLTQVLIRL